MGNRLFVGNLQRDTTEKELKEFLGSGRVESVYIVTDRETGQPRGFAFANMVSDAAAQQVIQVCDGRELNGRNLRINEAYERPSSSGYDQRDDRGGKKKRRRRQDQGSW